MRDQRAYLMLAAGSVVAAAAVLWLLVLRPSPREAGEALASATFPAAPEALPEPPAEVDTAGSAVVQAERSTRVLVEEVPAEEGEDVGGDPSPTQALQALEPLLRHSLETTLEGVMDPEVFVALAHVLVQLDVGSAIPEADPTGAVRFQLLGTPEGMSAELVFQQTNNPTFAPDVMSLRVEITPPEGTYIREGLARRNSRVHLGFWTDREGRPKNFGILTHLEPDPATRALGFPIDEGVIPLGMHYSFNADHMAMSALRVTGFTNGRIGPLEQHAHLSGSDPSMQDLTTLTSALQGMQASLKK